MQVWSCQWRIALRIAFTERDLVNLTESESVPKKKNTCKLTKHSLQSQNSRKMKKEKKMKTKKRRQNVVIGHTSRECCWWTIPTVIVNDQAAMEAERHRCVWPQSISGLTEHSPPLPSWAGRRLFDVANVLHVRRVELGVFLCRFDDSIKEIAANEVTVNQTAGLRSFAGK